ncbi:hypothetical protein [Geobacter sp. SVR]|uniref:hypothetical protein n=1 Tax=Geobacter sp. SVR TaxID=2495594 RepID=UPI00143EF97F|nr:hypothetical protein [Geobacter sp. SVR]BCS53657.1 hypothetical protein GSVR_19650 [Geobacter sp. SVR]GCF84146.1 hypothetical protein GSbR_07460 [Geobacter sp. SVR]
MTKTEVCPFFGKKDDYCDVGCGYISPHDVNQIIHYCNGRFKGCVKYRELVDRFPGGLVHLAKVVA